MTKENLVRSIVLTIKNTFSYMEKNWKGKIDLWEKDGQNVDFVTSGMICEKGEITTLCLILRTSEISMEESKIVTEALTEIHSEIEKLEKLTKEIERREISNIRVLFQITSPKDFLLETADNLKKEVKTTIIAV